MKYRSKRKSLPQFPIVQGDIFKLLVLFDQQSKIKRYSLHNDINQKESTKSLWVKKPEVVNVWQFWL